MDLAVDANIIFAALIKEGKTHELFFNERMHLFTPEFFFIEFEKHVKEILKKTNRTEKEFIQLISILKRKIVFIPLEELLPYVDEAEIICPDPDDIAYFALALKLKCPIWSNDKSLKKQKIVTVYSTEELVNILS